MELETGGGEYVQESMVIVVGAQSAQRSDSERVEEVLKSAKMGMLEVEGEGGSEEGLVGGSSGNELADSQDTVGTSGTVGELEGSGQSDEVEQIIGKTDGRDG
jgi:hypothetical protein